MQNSTSRLRTRAALLITLPLTWLALSMPVAAQIEEITVTATKREENVQDVPVAVSVLSQETIENSHAVGLEGLQALVPEQREVLLLVSLEGMSYRQVAEVLGIPTGTVMSRLHRSREQLRTWLDGEPGSSSGLRSVQ